MKISRQSNILMAVRFKKTLAGDLSLDSTTSTILSLLKTILDKKKDLLFWDFERQKKFC